MYMIFIYTPIFHILLYIIVLNFTFICPDLLALFLAVMSISV